jgi:hypothetical protein
LTGVKLWETQRGGWSIKGCVCQRAFWDRDGKEPTEYNEGDFARLFTEKPKIVLRYKDCGIEKDGGIEPIELAMLPLIVERLQNEHSDCVLHIRSVQDDGGGASVTITVEDLAGRSAKEFKARLAELEEQLCTAQRLFREEEGRRLFAEGMYQAAERLFGKVLEKRVSKKITFHAPITGPVAVEGEQHVGSIVRAKGKARVHVGNKTTYSANDLDAIRRLIADMVERHDELRAGLDAERLIKIEGKLADLRAELAKPVPDQGLVRESLRSLRTVLEGAAGNVIASGWLQVLQAFG